MLHCDNSVASQLEVIGCGEKLSLNIELRRIMLDAVLWKEGMIKKKINHGWVECQEML